MASNTSSKMQLSPNSTGSATGNPRNKTALQPGCSLMDWVALMNSGKDLTGTGGKMLRVTKEELSKHGADSKEPWIVLQGLVFNITHYKRFHPGGPEELLRGAGIDATRLFNEVHPWVSFQSMLSKCLVGKFIEKKQLLPPSITKKPAPFLQPPSPLPTVPSIPTLKSDFYQTDTNVVIDIYIKRQSLKEDQVIVETLNSPQVQVQILVLNFEDDFIQCVYSFGETEVLKEGLRVKISPQGKVEIVIRKSKAGKASIQMNSLERNMRFEDSITRSWTLVEKTQVTHDVYEFKFKRPLSLLYHQVPLGHHVALGLDSIEKMYTPVRQSSEDISFLIKIYPNGVLTPLLHALSIGGEVSMSNPRGTFSPPIVEKKLRLFAGGTGFTPMTRLIQYYMTLHTNITLYFFNKTKSDIIYQERLREWCKGSSLSVVHILSQDVEAEHPILTGRRISKSLLDDILDEEHERHLEYILICGPSLFTQETHRLLTENFGYSSQNVFKFGS